MAAIVLLGLPLLATIGLLALGLAAAADIQTGLDLVAGQVSGLFIAVAIVWILLLVVATLMLVRYVIHRAERS